MKIILDTNFLMTALRFKVDIFSELKGNELFVITNIISELEKLSKGNSKDVKYAKLSLEMVKRKGLKVLTSKEKNTDKSLVEYSKKGYAIATQDRPLKEIIKEKVSIQSLLKKL